MRQFRYVDFDCSECEASHTRLVHFDTDTGFPTEAERCDRVTDRCDDGEGGRVTFTCGGLLVPREMSGIGYMKTITKGNDDFNERERARLEKRADDHWKRQGRDEAIDRERAFMKKHGAAGGVR